MTTLAPPPSALQPIDSVTANLSGFLLEMVAFGVYMILFIQNMTIMYRRRLYTWTFGYQLVTCLLLATLIILHVAVDFKRTLDAFTAHPALHESDDSSAIFTSPAEFFSQFNTPQTRLRTGLYSGITVVADLFIVYRVSVVWSFNLYVSIFPILGFLASIGITVWYNLALANTVPSASFADTDIV